MELETNNSALAVVGDVALDTAKILVGTAIGVVVGLSFVKLAAVIGNKVEDLHDSKTLKTNEN